MILSIIWSYDLSRRAHDLSRRAHDLSRRAHLIRRAHLSRRVDTLLVREVNLHVFLEVEEGEFITLLDTKEFGKGLIG